MNDLEFIESEYKLVGDKERLAHSKFIKLFQTANRLKLQLKHGKGVNKQKLRFEIAGKINELNVLQKEKDKYKKKKAFLEKKRRQYE